MNKNIEILQKIESLLHELKEALGGDCVGEEKAGTKKTNRIIPGKFSGLTAEIFNLVQEGYFKERRKISEIEKKLHQRAINKPTTSLMKPLRLLVRKKIIDRDKPNEKGHYEYFQVNK